MAIPPPLRYWLIRLRALNRPLLWCSGLAIVLLALVLQEYRRHPEWLGQFEVHNSSPGQPGQNSTLSLEEQASIADIDTLSALYSDPSLNPGLALPPNSANSDSIQPSQNLLSLLQTPTPEGQPATESKTPEPSQSLGAPASPFATYLEQYRFLGRQPTTPPTAGLQTPSLLGSGALPGGSGMAQALPQSTTTLSQLSPLQQAVQQQYTTAQRRGAPQTALVEETGTLRTGAPEAGASSLAPAILPATLPGTNQTFLRTTPQMSPLPGTTGYVPPATLQPPAGSSYASPSPVPASITPNLSPISPNLGSNSNGINGNGTGRVLPPATGSLYSQPAAPPSATEPFSVPRPPGSHTGGGYIYTFSDPNGPSP
ncbi:MAG TPA: hypothetical protein V6D07_03300 [Trichocoleus sp.]